MSDDLERRLAESLRAYAALVDPPDGDRRSLRPAAPRATPGRWRAAALAAAAAAAVVIGALVVLAVRDPVSESAAGPPADSSVSAHDDLRAQAPVTATPSGRARSGDVAGAAGVALPPSPQVGVPYAVALSTHCGVRGMDIGGVWFAADPPLVEGAGNPPAGWGNPEQPGTLTLLGATQAVFADAAGHHVRLRADDAARPDPCD